MKKIGIITVVRTNNFGAELQAFALQKKLRNLGHDAEVIDYLYYKHIDHKASEKSKSEISFSKIDVLKKKLLYRVTVPISEIILPLFHSPTKRRLENFKNFHIGRTNFSTEFRSIEELYEYNHDYDVFVTGSDQVWNPATFTSLKPYFLDFASNDKIKISYAPSFGVSSIDNKYYQLYSKWLKELTYISVREAQGKELVEKLANRESTIVLDPTLLLSKQEWSDVIVGNIDNRPEKFILVYELHQSDYLINTANELGKKLGLPILKLCKRSFKNVQYDNIRNIADAGPSEFIELFHDASFVVTNSFHGTVFSANFSIPFYAVLNENRNNNSRLTDFLLLTGNQDRIVWEHKDLNIDQCMLIDFEETNNVLDKLRLESIKFIKQSMHPKQ